MTAALLSAAFVALLASSWYAGSYIERFLQSKYCWPLARRGAYMLLALWFETSILYTVWRVFA